MGIDEAEASMNVRDHLTALDRETWLRVRQGYLQVVDAVERRFGIEPRTAVCRDFVKKGLRTGALELRAGSLELPPNKERK